MLVSHIDNADLEQAYSWDGIGLRMNMVVSLDGKTTGRDGLSGSINTSGDKRIFSFLRRTADLVLVGAGTFRAEAYRPLTSGARLCIVSRSLHLDPASATLLHSTYRPIVLTCEASDAQRRHELGQVADVLVAGAETVDLPTGIDALHQAGLPRILCEGGPSLFADLLNDGLVDDVCLTIAAKSVGNPSAHPLTGPLADPVTWVGQHALHDADGVYSRWKPAA